jgi:hypothetical protein
MPINSEASLAAKLLSSSGTNDKFGVEHHVYEQRIRTTNGQKLRLKSDDLGDRCKIRGLFLPNDVVFSRDAVAEILIGGFEINSIPMRLIQALNDSKTDGFMEFSFDKFFGDSIYLHLVEKLCICELRFVNMPQEAEIEVLFECCWLNNKELVRMKGTTFDHFYKQVIHHQLPMNFIQNNLSVQNLIVCDRKENIKSINYNCICPDDLSQVSVIDYDERMVSIYGIKVNDKVTVFNMNPGKPWDCLYPEGNFNANKFDKERLVVERKNNANKPLDVYFLIINQLHYEKGMVGPRFAW